MSTLNLSIIGLDTSHAIAFTQRLQAPDCPENQKVQGARVIKDLRFETPFQSKEGLDQRQAQLESWGVKVTEDFDEAVEGADALIVTINDPAYHWEYFQKCAGLGKPIFFDKPLADNIENGKRIYELAQEKGTRMFSASSLRFDVNMLAAINEVPDPTYAYTYGPVGIAPAGSSIVWYGVHAFEMLERSIGRGAKTVTVIKDEVGAACVVGYGDKRRGVVELNLGCYPYGGNVRKEGQAVPYVVDGVMLYTNILNEMIPFFNGGPTPVAMEDTLEVMALLDAAERSYQSGKPEPVRL